MSNHDCRWNFFAGNDEESEAAARAIWVLAFQEKNAKVIFENQMIMESLRKISESKVSSST